MMELTESDVSALLPRRKAEAHKGDFGKLLLLCGSVGFTGAPFFAAMGALRSGAGLVYLGVPRSIYAIEAVKLNEPVIFPLPETGGMLSMDALPQILQRLPKWTRCSLVRVWASVKAPLPCWKPYCSRPGARWWWMPMA